MREVNSPPVVPAFLEHEIDNIYFKQTTTNNRVILNMPYATNMKANLVQGEFKQANKNQKSIPKEVTVKRINENTRCKTS